MRQMLNQKMKSCPNLEVSLAFRLMKASFEHQYYASYADECLDPFLKDDLLSKIDSLHQDYLDARNELLVTNPKALADCEASIQEQKAVYFSNQYMN